jgi:hypothetical protein
MGYTAKIFAFGDFSRASIADVWNISVLPELVEVVIQTLCPAFASFMALSWCIHKATIFRSFKKFREEVDNPALS